MKQLLNNPWVVGGLCALALLMVYFRLFDSKPKYEPPVETVQAQSTPSVTPVSLPPPSLPTAEAALVSNGPDTLPMIMDWPNELGRDPFRPIPRVEALRNPGFQREDQEDDGPRQQVSDGVMRLHAVFLDGAIKVAMINRQLVKEGEQFGGYVVDDIQQASVRLTSEEDTRVLEFTSSPKKQGSSS